MTTAPTPTQVKMIPASLVGNHIDRLDSLNTALSELAGLTAGSELDVPPTELLNLLSEKYAELRTTLARSVWPEGEAS